MKSNHFKIVLVTIFTFTLTLTVANANILDDFIEKYMKSIFSKGHGQGLPKVVEVLPEAEQYRNDFISSMGIVLNKEDSEITTITGNNIGLALVKKSNENEPAFDLILSKKSYNKLISWKNGKAFIEALKSYTKEHGCIPKITSTSHGWRSSGRTGEGHGLSGKSGFNGIYVYYKHGPNGIAKTGSRTFKDHVQKEVDKGRIKFCSSCVAQFYACNISTVFATSFAKMSGCQTVVATGQNSPYFQERDIDGGYKKIHRGAHYWKSASGVWEERQTNEMKEKNELKGSWFRATPIKNEHQEVIDVLSENLGKLYIAI